MIIYVCKIVLVFVVPNIRYTRSIRYTPRSFVWLLYLIVSILYINNCKAIFYIWHMLLFLICQGMWDLEGLSNTIIWEMSRWFSTPGIFFVGFVFGWNWEKKLWFGTNYMCYVRATYKFSKLLFMRGLGWKTISCKLRTCGTNIGIMNSSET